MRKALGVLFRNVYRVGWMLTLLLFFAAPIQAQAAGVIYEFGFVDENGNRLYGDLTFSRKYQLDQVVHLTQYSPTYTVELAAGDYYDISFQNEDGYSRAYTLLVSEKDVTEKPKHSVSAYPARIPCTVTVKYSDNTPASGVTVKTDYENAGGVTTGSDGTCKVYLTKAKSVNIQVYDGYKWVSKSVHATSPGAKTETFTIDRRVSVPVKVMLGGQEVTSALKMKAASADETVEVTGTTLPLLTGKTYTISAEHYEMEYSGYFVNEYKNGFSVSGTSYTAKTNPSTLTLNATLNKPMPYYWDWSGGSLEYTYPAEGSTYTLASGGTLTLYLGNRITSGAAYSYISSDTDVFTVDNGTITANNPGTATLTIKVQYGTASQQMTMNIAVPPKLIQRVSPSLTAKGGATPVTGIAEPEYTGTVFWDINSSVFDYNTTYKATIVLTPDEKYYFNESTAADGFQVSFDASSGKLTLTKEYTTAKAKINSMTVPQSFQLSEHSAKDEVLADLPATISVTAENGTFSLPVSWSCTEYSTAPEAKNSFAWNITDIGELDANGHALSGTITITNPKALEVTHQSKNAEITYDGSAYDVAKLFELDPNAGKAVYIVDSEKGSIKDSVLTIKEAGILAIKVMTEAKGIYASGEKTAYLTVHKGSGEAVVRMEDWIYGDVAKNPKPQSTTNDGDVAYTYKKVTDADTEYTDMVPVDAGDYIVKAVFAENGLYNSVTATDAFTIHRRTITVTADDLGKVYGDNDPQKLTWTVTEGELAGADMLLVDISREEGEAVGDYTITVSEKENANPNYNMTFENGTFSITRAPLTVTAEDKHIVYGEDAPEYTAAFAGFKNGDDKEDLGGALMPVCSYVPGMDKGSYAIEVSGYTSDNYTITYEDGTLEVAVKPITLTIEHKSTPYGDKAAQLTALDKENAIFSGDENVYVLSTDAAEDKEVGTYDIVGETVDDNYRITFVNGKDAYEITQREITLTITVDDKPYDGLNTATITQMILNNIIDRDDGLVGLEAGTATFASVDAAEGIDILFTEFKLSGAEAVLKNYKLIQPTGVTASITNNWTPEQGIEYLATAANENGWLNKDFVIMAAEGYELSKENKAEGVWEERFTGSTEGADNSITFFVRSKQTGAISLVKTENYKLDKNTEMSKTSGKVYFDERNGWESFLHTISFGLFYPEEVTVRVDAQDALSGVYSIEYTESDAALGIEEVKALSSWKTVPEDGVPVTLEDEKRFVYYVKITDRAGNVSYLSSDGAEYDTTAPAVDGVENGETYYTTQVLKVLDKNLESITVNGVEQTDLEAEIVLKGDTEAEYRIIAADKAGNTTEYVVSMKRLKALEQALKDIEPIKADPKDKETLEKLIVQVEQLLEDKDLTKEERSKLERIKEKAEERMEEVNAAIRAKKKIKEAAKKKAELAKLGEGNAAPMTSDNTNLLSVLCMLIASGWMCISCVRKAKRNNN